MKQPTDILNGLIKINNERINRYRDATMKLSKPAGRYSNVDLALLNSFACYIDQSAQAKGELKSLIAESGDYAEDHYSAVSLPDKTSASIKELLNDNERLAILKECMSVEKTTQEAYQKAIENDRLSAYMGETLSKQKNDLRAALRQIQTEIEEIVSKTAN